MADAAQALYEQFIHGGEARVAAAIARNESETQHLDFKESRDGQGRPTSLLTDSGRENLGKAISAFGNTGGGVLVWGVRSKDRRANGDSPIPDVATFVQELNSATAGLVDPPVVGVDHQPIFKRDEGGAETQAGYAVTYVPESAQKPHQCVAHDGVTNYYMRSGASVKPMPHAFVRALFAERARPRLDLLSQLVELVTVRNADTSYLGVNVRLALVNAGEVVARNVALAITTTPAAGLYAVAPMINPLGADVAHVGDGATEAARLFALAQDQVLYPSLALHVLTVHAQMEPMQRAGGLTIRARLHCDGDSQARNLSFPLERFADMKPRFATISMPWF